MEERNSIHWRPWCEANDVIRYNRPARPRLGNHRLAAETLADKTLLLCYFGSNDSSLPTKFAIVTHPEEL